MRPIALVLIVSVVSPQEKKDDVKAWVEGLGEKDSEKWRNATYRLIEKGAGAEDLRAAAVKSRADIVLWEARARKEHPTLYPEYAWVKIPEGSYSIPSLLTELEKQTSITLERTGFEHYFSEELTYDNPSERIPLLDALDRVIGTRIMDFSATRGKLRIWANTRMHQWRFGFGHTTVLLGSIVWSRTNKFSGRVEESISATVSFGTDPRLKVGGAGTPVLTGAIDDTGAAMEALPLEETGLRSNLRFRPPSEKATKIGRLSGYVPYFVVEKSETLRFEPPEPAKDRTLEKGDTELKLAGELAGTTPRVRLSAKRKDPSATALFPLAVKLVGKDDKRVDGTCDERYYQTQPTSWDFTFGKLPDGFAIQSIEVEWPVDQVPMRAWFEFSDIPLK